MHIFDHGTWSAYTFNTWPAGLPLGIAFCKSDIDGVDWYDYQRVGDLSHESVKAVCFNEGGFWIVKIATVDGSRLFPEGRRVIEIYDGDLDAPQDAYGGMVYDPATNTLSAYTPPAAVPNEITRRQLLIGLQSVGLITAQEAIDSSRGVGVPAGIQAVINELPTAALKTAATITWYSMSVAYRSDPLVAALAAAQDPAVPSEQIDQYWRDWSSL
ncbi:hypothetical protein AB8A28_14005 [Tardiphaga sp. 71_E8_N1_1]|uniref:hypothetical protein n=1 Tax=Tardiphaga sp. 71_E8_N1_1 TaxID=3240784 RepID=UPI003F899C13